MEELSKKLEKERERETMERQAPFVTAGLAEHVYLITSCLSGNRLRGY